MVAVVVAAAVVVDAAVDVAVDVVVATAAAVVDIVVAAGPALLIPGGPVRVRFVVIPVAPSFAVHVLESQMLTS